MNEVTITRKFKGSTKDLWQIWTDPDFIMQWFGGDPNGTVMEVASDLRQGGKYRISFNDSDGGSHTAFGEYLEVTPYELLKYTWEWESEPGHVSEVWVSFEPDGHHCELTLKHFNLSPSSVHGYFGGWSNALDKIQKLIIVSVR